MDTADLCQRGESTSLARREVSNPPVAWVSGACATPGGPNLGPAAIHLNYGSARTRINHQGWILPLAMVLTAWIIPLAGLARVRTRSADIACHHPYRKGPISGPT